MYKNDVSRNAYARWGIDCKNMHRMNDVKIRGIIFAREPDVDRYS